MKFNRLLLPTIVLFSFLIGSHINVSKNISDEKYKMIQHLSIIQSKINEVTNHNISKMNGLSTYISINTSMGIKDIDYYVQKVVHPDLDIISNIGIFKDTTAIYLYPYNENKVMSHINLKDIPDQKEDALRVKNLLEMVITPPVEVVQGGIGIMTRLPITLPDGSYWGQLGFMIKLDDIIKKLTLDNDKYSYVITQSNKSGTTTHDIYRNQANKNILVDEITVDIDTVSWNVQISLNDYISLFSITSNLLIFLGILFFIVTYKLLVRLKSNEEQIKKSELLLKSSMESSSKLIMMSIDKDYNYLYFNNNHQKIMRALYKTDSQVGFNILEHITNNNDRKNSKKYFDRAFSGEQVKTIQEFGEIHRSFFEIEYNPIFDKNREIIGASLFAYDITDRKLAEEALYNSTIELEWNKKLLNKTGMMAHIGGWELDLEKNKLVWTDEVKSIHEVPMEFVPDVNTAINFYSSGSKSIIRTALDQLIKNGESFDHILEIITYKGHSKWIHALGEGIFVDEKITKISGTFQDITERKRSEDLLQESKEQLLQSQKMDAVGHLAGGIAHDFNNSLAGIIGATELMLMDNFDLEKNKNKMLNIILGSAEKAGELTKQLLAFSRKSVQSNSVINVLDIIKETVEILRHTIDKNIVISIENNSKNPIVVGDGSLIQNSLINLAINSSHVMLEGGEIIFTIKNIFLDTNMCIASPFNVVPGEYAEVSIRDTGSGMSEDVLSHIFEPFFTTKEQGKGTGLGLSTVYQTIKDHNGAIYVDSKEGEGTTFVLIIPSTKISKSENKVNDVSFGTGTILIIDDDELIRDTSKAMIESLGYSVLIAENGEVGLTLFKEKSSDIDLIILDMIMPVMSGRETFSKLRELDADIPVIISSGFTKDNDLKTLKENDDQYFLHKPFRLLELSEIIVKALDQNK